MMNIKHKQPGFTIVELLIVIVVIGILAAITIVAYNGIQDRARDSKRQQDTDSIIKALNLYLVDNNTFPNTGGSTSIDSAWSTTADASWQTFATNIATYLKQLPADPISTPNVNFSSASNTYNYSVLHGSSTWICNGKDAFILTYRLASGVQKKSIPAGCNDPAWTNSSIIILTAN